MDNNNNNNNMNELNQNSEIQSHGSPAEEYQAKIFKVLSGVGIDPTKFDDPRKFNEDDLTKEIIEKGKIKAASDESIVEQYTKTGKQQVLEEFSAAVRTTIGISESELSGLTATQMIKRVNEEAKSQASQSAQQWDKERMRLLEKINYLENNLIPELKAQHALRLSEVSEENWIMQHLMGRELTHEHGIVRDAIIPKIKREFKIVQEDGSFEIRHKNGSQITDDNQARYLSTAEVITKVLEESKFLRQQNQNANPFAMQRPNYVGVNSQEGKSQQQQPQNQPAPMPSNSFSGFNEGSSMNVAYQKNLQRIQQTMIQQNNKYNSNNS